MASYMSELDWLTNPITNHVLSAELNNQSVNSLALLSARRTEEAVVVLQQMIANILLALTQAIDLRWLQKISGEPVKEVLKQYQAHYPQNLNITWYDIIFDTSMIHNIGSIDLGAVGKIRKLIDEDSFDNLVASQLGNGNLFVIVHFI